MLVHCVIGGYDYEGESFDSMKLFDCKSTAEAYKEDLENGYNNSGFNPYKMSYDYVLMQTKEIILQSMFSVA